MPVKWILTLCAAGLLAACSTPVPQTVVATLTPLPSSTTAATNTPTPAATPTPTPSPTPTPLPYRAVVRAHRQVRCGVDADRPDLVDFETEFCRAIAAALFNDPEAFEARPLKLNAAAIALAAGLLDVYVGPIDGAPPGVQTGPTLFVDAAGALARVDVGIHTLADLKSATVCLAPDSIDAQLFNAALTDSHVEVQPLGFDAGDADAMYQTYDQGHCDAVVDNRVRLAQRLPTLTVPADQGVIDLVLPIGLHGLLTSAGDENWTAIVNAVAAGVIRAEALGITSTDLDTFLASDDPSVRELLGVEGTLGKDLHLNSDFVTRSLRHVGNYGEIYVRYFPDLPRGPNALAQDGGQITAP